MENIIIAGYEYNTAESAAKAYKEEVMKVVHDDYPAHEAEVDIYEEIKERNDEIADFDATWTEVVEALNRI